MSWSFVAGEKLLIYLYKLTLATTVEQSNYCSLRMTIINAISKHKEINILTSRLSVNILHNLVCLNVQAIPYFTTFNTVSLKLVLNKLQL